MPVMPRPRTVILSATITSQLSTGGKQEADMGKKGNFWKAAVISTKEIEHKNIKKRAENENEQKNWENKYKNEKLLTDSICPLSPVSGWSVSPAVTMTSLCCTLFIVSVRFRFKLQCLLSTDKSLHIL